MRVLTHSLTHARTHSITLSLSLSLSQANSNPLAISQSTRNSIPYRSIPDMKKDKLVSFSESEGRHIVVQRGGDFWTIPVLREGEEVPAGEVCSDALAYWTINRSRNRNRRVNL